MDYIEKLTSQGERCCEECIRVNHGYQEKRKVWVDSDGEGGQG